MTRRLTTALGLLSAAVAGAAVATTVVGGPSATAAPGPLRTATATVVRTDLAETRLTQATLGYAPTEPVVNRLTGTYTWLADPGNTIQRGGVLYRVDDSPVVLFIGATPAWRPFALGMADGPDVAELEANLLALGDAHGLLSTADAHFDDATAQAVARWQASAGLPATGQVALGEVVFLPGAVRVGAPVATLGQQAAPGAGPFVVTTANRVVSVPLGPDLPAVTIGEAVVIVLPDQSRTPGTVVAVGPPPPGSAAGAADSSSGGGGGGSNPAEVTSVATVAPEHPDVTGTGDGVGVQVALTVESVHGVLAAPIAALLALAGGGYGVEVVELSGAHRLVGVTTGVFTGSQVQVTGEGVEAGTRVVVAQ